MRLSTRIVIAMLTLVVLTAFAVGGSSYLVLRGALVPSELARMELHARQVGQGIEADVRGSLNNVLALSYTRPLAGLVRARHADGVDPETGITLDEWRSRLAAIFLAHVQADPAYSRIRYIGVQDGGREVVRVERSHETGEVRNVPENELQQKGMRPFFQDAIKAPPGTVHLSRIDLNQDFGEIRKPYLPNLRQSAPILAPDGSVDGILIINLDMRATLDRVRNSKLPYGEVILMDHEGNYLVHPDPEKEFAFDLGQPQRLQDDMPELFGKAVPAARLSKILRTEDAPAQAVVVEHFMLGDMLPLYVVETLPYAAIIAPATTVRNSTLVSILGAAIIAVLLSILLARSLTRPLESMTRALLGGAAEAPVEAGGEVGMMARAFKQLHDEVTEKTEALAVEVEERMEVSAALKDSLAKVLLFNAVVESSGDAIVTMKPDGSVSGWNPAAQEMFHHDSEEVVGRHILDAVSFKDAPALREAIERVLLGIKVEHWEATAVKPDGKLLELLITVSPVKSASGEIIGASFIARDNTEHRSIEAQLRHAQKMEAVGQLAGGVAHDFNNLLTIIIGCTEFLFERKDIPDDAHNLLKEVHQAGMRAAGLTRQLLAFSRRSIISTSTIRVNMLICEMEKMIRRLIGEDVEVNLHLGSDLPPVTADPAQIEQVLMNLVVNARDAMPTGGILIIESKFITLDEVYADMHIEVEPGDYVVIAISDNGVGMPESVRSRIFDPFYTTKEVGKGTGLGLSTVYGIIKQAGGHITCYSEPGRGTTFKIYLPATVGGELHRHPQTKESVDIYRGSETILLVEDEEGVRALALRVLEKAGYNVIDACDGEEVSNKIHEHDGPIHLVLTDVVLPTLSGREIADAVCMVYPKAKVLYASGYTDDAIVRYGVLRSEMAFLHKPFTPLTLLKKVREVLDSDDKARIE